MDASRAQGSVCASRLVLVICAVVGTLVLAVPSTTLLVMYFTPDGGQLSSTGQVSPKAEREMEELQQEDKLDKLSASQKQLNPGKPTAHLTAVIPNLESKTWTLEWEATPSFLLQRTSPVLIPKQGLYYVYCQVAFRNRSCHADSPLILFSKVFQRHDANQWKPMLLLESSDTVCEQGQGGGKTWYTSVSQGALVLLEEGHQLYVNVSHPRLVDYQEGKTFFGFMMVS